jgi:glutamate/tyrosine decarboxylase-like PLP-dependent enzyme
MFPEAKKGGMDFSLNPVSFTSAHAHYTVQRTVSVLGMGLEGCLPVEVDEEGRMKPDVLDKMITEAVAEGKKPWMVAATSGTTVYGAYDGIRAIAEVCKKHSVWLHVDACWGGHCLFSDRERHWMDGVEMADSVSVTGTKCFGLPQQCAAVLVRQKGLLRATNAMNADYLFHEYDEKNYDVGELTLNCGRRVDAFKLWLSWKVHGNKGMSERVEHAFDIARFMERQIRESKNVFEMAHHPESLNVCFWYLPKYMRGRERTEEDIAVLDSLTGRIRRRLQLEGRALTNFADVPGQAHFFRHICCNPGANADDIDFLLSELARIGDDLSEAPAEEEL